MDEPFDRSTNKRPTRRLRIAGILLLLAATLTFAAPSIIAHTGLRDTLINAIMGTPNLTASTQQASLGWFSPPAVGQMEITGKQGRFRVQIESVTADRSWPRLLASSTDLGTITVEKPHLDLQLPLGERSTPAALVSPTFVAAVRDAGLTVRTQEMDEPVIDVHGIDMTLRVQSADERRILTLDPVELFQQRSLTPKLCRQLLQLINPSLGTATEVDGQFSLSLNKVRIPLGIPEEQLVELIEVEGELALHQVSMKTESSMLQALSKVLADLHDTNTPATIRVVKDVAIQFWARDGRLFHEGLRLGFPDIHPNLQVSTRGSVGLDETLDLHLEVPRFDQAKHEQYGPVHCHITGTISHPRLFAKNASLVVHIPDRPEPLIDVDDIDLIVTMEDAPSGQVLSVAPLEIIKRQKISRQLASGLVHLIEPAIQYTPQLTGEISVSIDKLRIPLSLAEKDWLESLEVHGKVTIHEATTQATDPIRQAVLKVLADLYSTQMSERARIVYDTELDFELRDGRMHYDGLRFACPDIDPRLQVTSRGSIGLDETLDVHVEFPRLNNDQDRALGPVRCHITGTITAPQMSVQNASLVVDGPNRAEPLIDIDNIDLTIRVEQTPIGRVLSVDPVEVFKRRKFDQHLGSGIVKLIDPEIQYTSQLTGEVSLSLDKLRVPLETSEEDWIKGLEAHGQLTIHEATTWANEPIRQALVKLLADMYSVETGQEVRLVYDTDIEFALRDGRMHFSGLQFGFPDIDPQLQVTSQGSIGLDETLDLHLQVPRPDKTSQHDLGPVQCHITGTVSNPQFAAQNASLVIRSPNYDSPLLKVDTIDVTMTVETQGQVRTLVVAPVTIFDKQTVSPALGDELLGLVAPTLGDIAHVRGQISLSFESIRVPLSTSKEPILNEIELVGQLQMHDLSTTVESPLLSALVKVMADLYGKQPSDVVRVVKDADIRFEVRRGRLFHEGLRIGFPDISPDLMATSHGSVGLDRSLDLTLEVPAILAKSEASRGDAPSEYLRWKITGTIESPTIVEIKNQ